MNGITLEHLSPTQREVAELIGFDNYLKMVERYGGTSGVYFPKQSELEKFPRNKEIRAKFTGFNQDELAAEYDLTARTIYSIVSDLIQERKAAQIPGQMALQ